MCTYVGDEGWSRHWLCSRDRNDAGSEVFRFDQAVALHTYELTCNSAGPNSWETRHSRIWRDSQGSTIAKITGKWKGQGDKPEASDPWWFAVSAEASWNIHWLDQHRHALVSGGPVEFPMLRGRGIRIGNGYIEIDGNRKASRVPLEEIVSLNLLGGSFSLEVSNKSLLKGGSLRLRNHEIPNMQGFLYAISQVLGHPLGKMAGADAGEGAGAPPG